MDPRCPIAGVREAVKAATEEYEMQGAGNAIELFVEPGVAHEMTAGMWGKIDPFLEAALLTWERRGVKRKLVEPSAPSSRL